MEEKATIRCKVIRKARASIENIVHLQPILLTSLSLPVDYYQHLCYWFRESDFSSKKQHNIEYKAYASIFNREVTEQQALCMWFMTTENLPGTIRCNNGFYLILHISQLSFTSHSESCRKKQLLHDKITMKLSFRFPLKALHKHITPAKMFSLSLHVTVKALNLSFIIWFANK